MNTSSFRTRDISFSDDNFLAHSIPAFLLGQRPRRPRPPPSGWRPQKSRNKDRSFKRRSALGTAKEGGEGGRDRGAAARRPAWQLADDGAEAATDTERGRETRRPTEAGVRSETEAAAAGRRLPNSPPSTPPPDPKSEKKHELANGRTPTDARTGRTAEFYDLWKKNPVQPGFFSSSH